jgi:hypothetical protein
VWRLQFSLTFDLQVRGSMQLHDIVRDYCLSQVKGNALVKLNRSFVRQLLLAMEEETAYMKWSAYVANHLAHHIRGSIQVPLTQDVLFQVALAIVYNHA